MSYFFLVVQMSLTSFCIPTQTVLRQVVFCQLFWVSVLFQHTRKMFDNWRILKMATVKSVEHRNNSFSITYIIRWRSKLLPLGFSVRIQFIQKNFNRFYRGQFLIWSRENTFRLAFCFWVKRYLILDQIVAVRPRFHVQEIWKRRPAFAVLIDFIKMSDSAQINACVLVCFLLAQLV